MAENKVNSNKRMYVKRGNSTGALYGMGFIGAIIYYFHFHSGTIWLVILAILKALFWPALLVYHLLLFLHM